MAKRIIGRVILYILLSILSAPALAGGFSLYEENVSGLGNAYAGTGAVAEDASTEYYNPAAMVVLEDPQMVFAGTAINLDIDSHVNSATNTETATFPIIGPVTVTEPVTGRSDSNAGSLSLVPAFHFVYPYDRFAIGFGVTSPYGLRTNYSSDTMSRFLATESKIVVFNVGPNLALQITPQFSIGAGVDGQYLSAALNQSVPVIDPNSLLTGPTLAEGVIQNTATNWAYGWNAGTLFQFSPCTRIGLSYRSRIDHRIDNGTATLDFPTVPDFGATFGTATTDVVIPASANLSFFHRINPQWEFMSGLDWTHWGSIDQLTINYSGPITDFIQSSTLVLDWRDTYRYSLGLNYIPIPRWKLRTGFAWDESPVHSADTRTFRLPDSDRIWLSFGTQYCINEYVTVDVGYSHLFVSDSTTTVAQTVQGNINLPAVGVPIPYTFVSSANGTFDSSVDELGLQITWHIV